MAARDLAVGRPRSPSVSSGIRFSIDAGESVAITGPNGAGKSTLALTLGGLLPPHAGTLDASGLAGGLGPSPIRWRSRELVSRIGSVFQEPEHQFVAATVRDELAVGARALGLSVDDARHRIDVLLERLRLTRLARANPFTLSGGEKRRLSVATALVTKPRLLVLDEPTFGQDARTWRELVALLAELLDDGSAIVTVTHDVHLVRALAGTELRMSRLSLEAVPGGDR